MRRAPNYVRGVRKKPLVSACVVTAAVVLFLWDVLLAGQTFYLRDVIFDALPWRRFASGVLAQGELPLWNPHGRCGQPFLANPQSAVLYPPHLLFVLLPVKWALELNLLGHLLLGGISMAALLRRFGLHHAATAFGGIVWALGGYMTANLEFMSVAETLAWTPLTVLLTVRLVDPAPAGRAARALVARGAALAVAIAVQLLAGQVQPVGFNLFLALAFMGIAARSGRAPWWRGGSTDERRRAVVGGVLLGAAVLVAAGLTAVQWMPSRELLPLSIRSHVDPGLGIASASPRHLLHLLAPFFSGRPGADSWHGGSLFEFWLGSIYIGLLPLLLVPAAFTLRWKDAPAGRLTVACALVAGIGLLLALGENTPLYGLLLRVLPGWDLLRWPAKAFQLVVFALTVLSATGLHAVLRARDAEGRRCLGAATGAALLCAGALALAARGAEDAPRGVVFAVLAGGAFLALRSSRVPLRAALAVAFVVVVADLYVVSRQIQLVAGGDILDAVPRKVPDGGGRVHTAYTNVQFELYGSRDPAEFARAVDLLAGDTALSGGIDSTYGGDALQVAATRNVTDLLAALPAPQRERLADVLGVTQELAGPPFEELRRGRSEARWRARPGALPRAYVARRWENVAEPVAAMERLLAADFDPRRSAIVGASAPRESVATGADAATIERAAFERESVAIDVRVTRRSLLVVTDTFFPGWTAQVDGSPREIVQVNVIFRGIVLEPGDREVRMRYAPRSFRTGLLWMTFTSLALLAVLASVLLPRRRRRAPPVA